MRWRLLRKWTKIWRRNEIYNKCTVVLWYQWMITALCVRRRLNHLQENNRVVGEILQNFHLLFAGLLSRCHYTLPEGPPIGHLDSCFPGFPLSSSNRWDVAQDPSSCYRVLLMQPSRFKFINISIPLKLLFQINNRQIELPRSWCQVTVAAILCLQLHNCVT
jgi:hypothetical protein